MFFLWTNCLISHRIDTKLYILQKWHQACLNAAELVVIVSRVSCRFNEELSLPAPRPPAFESSGKSVFLTARSLMILFLTFFFFTCQLFLLRVSVVHFRNQRCWIHPSFSSLSQTNCSHPLTIICLVQLVSTEARRGKC